jgi:hypothetical protein
MPCGHESHGHGHSHEDTSDLRLGSQDNLFLQIDRDNAAALNTLGSGSDVIKPWHARLDETQVAFEIYLVDRND